MKHNKVLVLINLKDEKYKTQGCYINNFELKVTSDGLVIALSKIETAATPAPSVVKTMN